MDKLSGPVGKALISPNESVSQPMHILVQILVCDYASDYQCVCCVLPDVYLQSLDVSLTHVVARCVGLHGVLGCQGDAAHGNDHQDAHFKVA